MLISIFIGNIDLPITFNYDKNFGFITYDYVISINDILKNDDCLIIKNKSFKRIPTPKPYYISKDGMVFSDMMKKGFIKRAFNGKGYLRVGNIYKNRSTSIEVHKLVYETYVGPVVNEMTIDHIDGNKLNNHIDNLELVSAAENIRRGYRTGTRNDIKWNSDTIHYICKSMEDGISITDIAKSLKIQDKKRYRNLIVLACQLRENSIWYEISSKYNYDKYDNGRKLTANVVKEICDLLNQNYSMKSIAKMFNISDVTVSDIKKHKIWKNITDKYLNNSTHYLDITIQ